MGDQMKGGRGRRREQGGDGGGEDEEEREEVGLKVRHLWRQVTGCKSDKKENLLTPSSSLSPHYHQ